MSDSVGRLRTSRAVLSVLLGTLVGVLMLPASGSANHVIKIGAVAALTGPDAEWGQEIVNVAKFALEERGGQINGHRIEFLVEDDKSDPKEAVAIAHKLVNAKVFAVIGHFNSGTTLPASGIYNEAGIIHVVPTASDARITERNLKRLYRITTRHDQQALFVADYLANIVKAKRVAIITDKTAAGDGLASDLRRELGKRGLSPVSYEGIVRGEKDFTPVVTKLKPLNPDYTYFTGLYAEAGLLVRQFREVGVPGKFFAGDGVNDRVYVDTAGRAAEGTLISTAPLPEQLSSAATFYKRWRAKYDRAGPYIHYCYDAATVLFMAMEKAGADKTDNVDAVNALLRKTNFRGASGLITFDEKGDVIGREKQFILLEVRNGKYEIFYAPKEVQ